MQLQKLLHPLETPKSPARSDLRGLFCPQEMSAHTHHNQGLVGDNSKVQHTQGHRSCTPSLAQIYTKISPLSHLCLFTPSLFKTSQTSSMVSKPGHRKHSGSLPGQFVSPHILLPKAGGDICSARYAQLFGCCSQRVPQDQGSPLNFSETLRNEFAVVQDQAPREKIQGAKRLFNPLGRR